MTGCRLLAETRHSSNRIRLPRSRRGCRLPAFSPRRTVKMPQFHEKQPARRRRKKLQHPADQAPQILLQELVKSLHDYVRKTDLTFEEWEYAIDFLTRTGHKCTDIRQEFILLSDVMGVSMLVETINERNAPGATHSTVLGPFHVVASPERALGDTIDLVGEGEPCVVTGRVTDLDG